jgi:hypothetical protein
VGAVAAGRAEDVERADDVVTMEGGGQYRRRKETRTKSPPDAAFRAERAPSAVPERRLIDSLPARTAGGVEDDGVLLQGRPVIEEKE